MRFPLKTQGKVMVLFDSLSIRDETVTYAIELASRMERSLVFLLVISTGWDELSETELKAERLLSGPLDLARGAGLAAEAVVRTGNPYSELMKYLAGAKSIHAIVWGGGQEVADPKGGRDHWLSRVKDLVECPVVFPLAK